MFLIFVSICKDFSIFLGYPPRILGGITWSFKDFSIFLGYPPRILGGIT
jgi:hypothetical protein